MLRMYPAIPLIFLGVAYALFGAIIWPSMSLLVNPNNLGLALGIATSLTNLGFTIIPLVMAELF